MSSLREGVALSAGLLRTITEVQGKRLAYLSEHRLTTLARLCLANEAVQRSKRGKAREARLLGTPENMG